MAEFNQYYLENIISNSTSYPYQVIGALLKIITSYNFTKYHMFISSGFIFKISHSFYWTFTEIGRSFLKTTLADQFQEVAFLKHSENLHFSEPINDQWFLHNKKIGCSRIKVETLVWNLSIQKQSPRSVLLNRCFFRNLAKFTGKHLCKSFFFKGLQLY